MVPLTLPWEMPTGRSAVAGLAQGDWAFWDLSSVRESGRLCRDHLCAEYERERDPVREEKVAGPATRAAHPKPSEAAEGN